MVVSFSCWILYRIHNENILNKLVLQNISIYLWWFILSNNKHLFSRYLVGVPEKIGIQCFDYSDRHFLVALENGIISSYLCEITRNLKGILYYHKQKLSPQQS